MNAADALELARQSGVRVELNGANLALSAAERPPDYVLDSLKLFKLDIIDLITQQGGDPPPTMAGAAWDAETGRLIAWFKKAAPPTEPFELCRGVTILNPAHRD